MVSYRGLPEENAEKVREMRKSVPIFLLLVSGVVVIAGIVYSFYRYREKVSELQEKKIDTNIAKKLGKGVFSQEVLDVNYLAQNPEKFTEKKIMLQGVVAGINKVEHVFAVADLKEFRSEGHICDDDPLIPVEYHGKIPPFKSAVRILGTLEKTSGGFVVKAEKVEVIP